MDGSSDCKRRTCASTSPANASGNHPLLAAARLTIFLVLAFIVAFAAPAVGAEGEAPPPPEGGEVAADPSGESPSDSTGTDPAPTVPAPTTTTETLDASETNLPSG